MNYRKEPLPLDPAKVYVLLFTYTFKKKGIAKFTAPFVRLFTGQMENHCGLLAFARGHWRIYEANEKGIVETLAAETLDRVGSRIQIREYTGKLSTSTILVIARSHVGLKYDTANLVFHQLIYRITKEVGTWINCFVGREVVMPIWLGRTGEKAKGRQQCFEYLFTIFNLPTPWLASGAEFKTQPDFNIIIFKEA